MASNRKERRAKQAAEKQEMKSGIEEISEEEQWRLINESGVLSNIPKSATPGETKSRPKDDAEAESDEPFSPFCEEIFQSILFIIPMSSLYVMMIIMAHRQYAQEVTKGVLLEQLLTSFPLLSVFIFYTTRYKADRRMQIGLTILSIISGCRLIYVVNRTNWTVIMRQCPPLGTIWVYTVIQLELGKAVAALVAVAADIGIHDETARRDVAYLSKETSIRVHPVGAAPTSRRPSATRGRRRRLHPDGTFYEHKTEERFRFPGDP